MIPGHALELGNYYQQNQDYINIQQNDMAVFKQFTSYKRPMSPKHGAYI